MRTVHATMVILILAAACAGPADPAGPGAEPLDPGDLPTVADGSEVAVVGALVVRAGEARLCSALAESFPPQCAGDSVVLEGLDPAEVVGLSHAQDVVWSDFSLTVRGTARGQTLVVTGVAQETAQATGGDLRFRFAAHPAPLRSGEQVTWSFDLTNLGDQPVSAEYNPAQPAEVVLLRDGEEAYRFTEGKVFTQSIELRDLSPGEPAGFALSDELPVPPGTYTARATFVGTPEAPPVELTLTVEG